MSNDGTESPILVFGDTSEGHVHAWPGENPKFQAPDGNLFLRYDQGDPVWNQDVCTCQCCDCGCRHDCDPCNEAQIDGTPNLKGEGEHNSYHSFMFCTQVTLRADTYGRPDWPHYSTVEECEPARDQWQVFVNSETEGDRR